MARDFNFQPIDYIFEQLSRIPHYTLNEGDVATQVSLALGFMHKLAVQEDAVIFLPVKNNIAEMPFGYTEIHRISLYTKPMHIHEDENLMDMLFEPYDCKDCGSSGDCDDCKKSKCDECEEDEGPSQDFIAFKYPYGKFINMPYYRKSFVPIRPSNNAFFSSLACKNELLSDVYRGCQYEYSIRKGLKKRILFSFSEGYVAVSYKRYLTDDETGFPLIPDDSNAVMAILSFVKADIFEHLGYAGRENYINLADRERVKWLTYIKQFNNAAKMPQTEDDYQSDMESKLGAVPNRNRYYGDFSRVARRRRLM